MPHNKKHHFVPRMYLKRFAQHNGKTINIHNLRNKKTILGGNLYNQCYRDYLYGKDGVFEEALGVIESAAAKVLSSIADARNVPQRMTEPYLHLLVFVLFQKNRTLAAGEELNEQMDQLHDHFFVELASRAAAEKGISRSQLEEVTIRYEHPERAALGLTAQLIPMALDLNLKVLERAGHVEFITSDNPVVFYNPFSLGSQRREGSATGFQSKGLQIYMPVSSKLSLVYYDGAIYKIGDRKKLIVPIDEAGVKSLNSLQTLNAFENIYFYSDSMAASVEKEAARAASRRPAARSRVRTIPTSTKGEVVHLFRQDIEVKVVLPFYKLREKPPAIWDPRTIPPRNPGLSGLYELFHREIDDGKRRPGDFFDFLRDLSGRSTGAARRDDAARAPGDVPPTSPGS